MIKKGDKGLGNLNASRATVMLLDDDFTVRVSLRKVLERFGFNILTAGNYQEFIDSMTDCDVILSDIILPGSNGLQALKWAQEHYPDIPVIMMTGRPTYQSAAEAVREGAYDYLAKPINPDDLLHTIRRAIQHRHLTLETERLEAENKLYRLQLEQRVEEQTRALRESQEYLTTLTNTMADAVLSIELPDYQIEYMNDATTEIFGYLPEELAGQSLSILYPDELEFKAFVQRHNTALSLGQSKMRFEQKLQKKDGQTIWTEIVATFIESEEYSSQIIAVIRDITERSFLLGVVAHELRSPLGLLNGFSLAMMDDLENLDQNSLTAYLNIINDNTTRMLKLVNDLLDMTSIELGKVPLQIEMINLSDLLTATCENYSFVARKKNITLTPRLEMEIVMCKCDPLKIRQVVSNFIDNAIKFSPTESTIQIIGRQQDANAWVGIKDEGPGIKSNELQHVFKSFGHRQISSQPTAGEKSSGLGLAICKKIIEAHRGEIGVDSAAGKGSTFWFTLPLPDPSA